VTGKDIYMQEPWS